MTSVGALLGITAIALSLAGSARAEPTTDERTLRGLLDAYGRAPSSELLLEIAAVLRGMGRLADAANTYQRCASDPAASEARVSECEQVLGLLDAQLATLTVRAADAQVSIDGGAFVHVGGALALRVTPGPHAIRVRDRDHDRAKMREVDVFAFAGQPKLVDLGGGTGGPIREGWLLGRDDLAAAEPAPAAAPKVPEPHADRDGAIDRISSGALVEARLDGNRGEGFALGLGVVLRATQRLEVDLEGMKSDVYGAYVGARYVLRPTRFRPFIALGMPLFFFTDDGGADQIVVGLRLAAGLEVVINRHVAVQAELGIETYFNTDNIIYRDQMFDRNQFAPSLGVIGRL